MEREGHIMLNCPKCEAPCRAEDEHCGRCGQSLTADVVEDPITLRDAGLLRGISAPADGGPAITTGDIGSIPEGIRTGGTGGANVAMGDVGYVGSVNINISPEAIASLLEGQRRLFQGSLETISGNSGTVANRFELREIIGRSGMVHC